MKIFSFLLRPGRNVVVVANSEKEARELIMAFDDYKLEDIGLICCNDIPSKPDIIHLF